MTIIYVDDDPDDQAMFLDACREIDTTIDVKKFGTCLQVEKFVRNDREKATFYFIETSIPGPGGYECANMARQYSQATIVLCSTEFNPSVQQAFTKTQVMYMVKGNTFSAWVYSVRKMINEPYSGV